jgi:hypothetical protein
MWEYVGRQWNGATPTYLDFLLVVCFLLFTVFFFAVFLLKAAAQPSEYFRLEPVRKIVIEAIL